MLSRFLLYILGLLVVASWGALGALIMRSSPDALFARVLFFAFAFLGVFLTFSWLAYFSRLRTSAPEGTGDGFRASIFIGIPPAVAVTVALWLQSLRVLNVVSGSILAVGAVLVELAMIVNGRKNRESRRIQESGQ